MRLRDVDTDRDVLIVAEIGNNHEGDCALAERATRFGRSGSRSSAFAS